MKFEEGTSVNLLDNPSREFLMMGDMTKLSRRGPQQHTFWLFNDLLLYGDKKLNGSYKVNRSIQLLKCQVSSPSEEEVKASEDVKVRVRRGGGGSECQREPRDEVTKNHPPIKYAM